MNYSEKVYHYFKFSSLTYTHINGRNKRTAQITGKPSTKALIVWFIYALCMSGLAYALNMDNFESVKDALLTIVSLFFVTIIIVLVRSKLVFRKLEPKRTNINLYNRELPSNLRPAHMRLLINDGLVDELSLASTIVDLVDRGFLDIKKEGLNGQKNALFNDKSLVLVKTSKPDESLLKYEKFIIDWFIGQYGNGIEVSQEQVVQGLLSKVGSASSKPYELFETWQALVIMSFPLNKYFKRNNVDKERIIYAIFAFLGFTEVIPILIQFIGIYSVGCLLFASPMYVLNKLGVEEIGEWLNLKRFLLTFGDMKEKTAEMVKIWDFYLTYSVALNVSTDAAKEIDNFFGDNIFKGIGNSKESLGDSNIEKFSDVEHLISKSNIGFNEFNKQLELEIAEEMKKL